MILTQNMIANVALWVVHIIAVAGILPQIFLNYKVKSTYGLSNIYILIYLFGNVTQLFYVFCLDLPIAYKIMSPLSLLLVLALVIQCFIYNKQKFECCSIRLYSVNFFILFLLIVLAINFPHKIGHLAGWISLVVWIVYQLPQVYKIYSKKSVEGFSFVTILFMGFQNLLGLIAILALGIPLQSVFAALRGLIFVVIFCFQFWIYGKKSKQTASI
ncbi:PQ-loop repeat-containing protein [Candidatus Babeliales bacterium]|nr:PQ-loop repeat-containing protein [Candidatus Babeliales bacterium]